MKSIPYALLLLPLLTSPAFAGEFSFRTAALTGGHPAGMPADAEFTSFEAPALNNSGVLLALIVYLTVAIRTPQHGFLVPKLTGPRFSL